MAENNSRLFIISGASGTGKTSLVQKLLQSDQMLEVSISHTTRKPLPGERDGHDYHFVSEQEFTRMLEKGEFLEHARIYGHHYGTSRQNVLYSLEQGKDMLLEIDWQGAKQVCASFATAVTVFILPPDVATLRSRLEGRGRDSHEAINSRLDNALEEISHADNYSHLLVNSDLDQATAQLQQIIAAYRSGKSVDQGLNRPHWRQLTATRG